MLRDLIDHWYIDFSMAIGTDRYRRLTHTISAKVIERLPDTLAHVEDYARESMDVRNLLAAKMQQLDELQFEALIRPAFEQDE